MKTFFKLILLLMMMGCASSPKESPKESLQHMMFDIMREYNHSPSKALDYEQYQLERKKILESDHHNQS